MNDDEVGWLVVLRGFSEMGEGRDEMLFGTRCLIITLAWLCLVTVSAYLFILWRSETT